MEKHEITAALLRIRELLEKRDEAGDAAEIDALSVELHADLDSLLEDLAS